MGRWHLDTLGNNLNVPVQDMLALELRWSHRELPHPDRITVHRVRRARLRGGASRSRTSCAASPTPRRRALLLLPAAAALLRLAHASTQQQGRGLICIATLWPAS